ncbi:MAG: copper amine oxidase N-terminal domain-containing protein [Clostridia bacterium]|nr:copper amine oxidase N-terminal domain-containing protein [Clostridia bacterium]
MVDGKYVDCASYGQTPVIVEGRTLVPLRSVFEALGATVEWNNEKRAAISEKGDLVVVVAIDSKEMMVDGTPKAIDVPAQIMNGRTMVPVRAVAEAFGCKVEWDNATRTVIITTATVEQGEDVEIEVSEGTPEAAVLAMWACLKAGDFEGMKAYLAEGAEIEGLTDLEEMVAEGLGADMDMSQFTPEQAEKMQSVTVKLVKTMLGIMTLEIKGTTMVDDSTALVEVVTGIPDLEQLNAEEVVDEEAMMALMFEVMAEKGYSLDAIATMSEAEQTALGVDVGIAMIEYLCDIIAENTDALPLIEADPVYLTVKNINGQWIIVE